MRILAFVKYYLPGYKTGGPLRTLEHMVAQLGGDFLFRVVTSDRDAGDTWPYPGVTVERWLKPFFTPEMAAAYEALLTQRRITDDARSVGSDTNP